MFQVLHKEVNRAAKQIASRKKYMLFVGQFAKS